MTIKDLEKCSCRKILFNRNLPYRKSKNPNKTARSLTRLYCMSQSLLTRFFISFWEDWSGKRRILSYIRLSGLSIVYTICLNNVLILRGENVGVPDKNILHNKGILLWTNWKNLQQCQKNDLETTQSLSRLH